ncbi:MAG: hypothetical protein QF552_03205 [Litorilituus sp.]|nr:hypothetical protein [Litorilituus sp.]
MSIFYTLASDRHPNSGGGGNNDNVAGSLIHSSKMPYLYPSVNPQWHS